MFISSPVLPLQKPYVFIIPRLYKLSISLINWLVSFWNWLILYLFLSTNMWFSACDRLFLKKKFLIESNLKIKTNNRSFIKIVISQVKYIMVDLKKDLDEYLLLQSDQKKSYKIQMPTIQKPNITNWFKRNETTEEQSTWFQETKKECCPSLVTINSITFLCNCLINVCNFSHVSNESPCSAFVSEWESCAFPFR